MYMLHLVISQTAEELKFNASAHFSDTSSGEISSKKSGWPWHCPLNHLAPFKMLLTTHPPGTESSAAGKRLLLQFQFGCRDWHTNCKLQVLITPYGTKTNPKKVNKNIHIARLQTIQRNPKKPFENCRASSEDRSISIGRFLLGRKKTS